MTFTFPCPSCHQKLTVVAEPGQSKATCQFCYTAFQLPSSGAALQGAEVGGYTIQHLAGQSGIWDIYAAITRTQEAVTLKVLAPGMVRNPAVEGENFVAQTESLMRLNHRNIVRCVDAGDDGGCYYLVMLNQPGQTLQDYVTGVGPLPATDALTISVYLAQALR